MPTQSVVTPAWWTPRGEAWVEAQGRRKPMVVWGGIPGERAKVRVYGGGQHQVRAEWLETRDAHEYRVDPPCDRYDACGGCPWMHMTPKGQAAAHAGMVHHALHEAGVGIEIDAWHPSPDGHADFRHVVKIGIGKNDMDRTKIGAWGRNTRRVTPIPECVVAAPVLNKTMKSVAHHVLELEVWPWEPQTDRGVLRAAVLRASRTTGEVMVTLVAARKSARLRDLAEEIAGGVPEVVGIWLHLNDDPGNAIFQRDEDGVVGVLPLQGKDTITEILGGVEYRIGPGDFFQTNPSVAELIYARTMERLQPGKEDAFVDLYCGVGGLALQAAKHGAGFVVGIEGVDGAVQRARAAARSNRLNAEFLSGEVLQTLPDLGRRLGGVAPIVTVNPARRGLEDGVVDALLALRPRKLAYISCNPTALARDLAAFKRAGFRPDGGVELFDMFPNTPHVESLVVLDGPEADGPKRRAPRRKVVRPS